MTEVKLNGIVVHKGDILLRCVRRGGLRAKSKSVWHPLGTVRITNITDLSICIGPLKGDRYPIRDGNCNTSELTADRAAINEFRLSCDAEAKDRAMRAAQQARQEAEPARILARKIMAYLTTGETYPEDAIARLESLGMDRLRSIADAIGLAEPKAAE